jgi:hypothetical protein
MDTSHSWTSPEYTSAGVGFGDDSRASEEKEGVKLSDFLYSSCYWYDIIRLLGFRGLLVSVLLCCKSSMGS